QPPRLWLTVRPQGRDALAEAALAGLDSGLTAEASPAAHYRVDTRPRFDRMLLLFSDRILGHSLSIESNDLAALPTALTRFDSPLVMYRDLLESVIELEPGVAAAPLQAGQVRVEVLDWQPASVQLRLTWTLGDLAQRQVDSLAWGPDGVLESPQLFADNGGVGAIDETALAQVRPLPAWMLPLLAAHSDAARPDYALYNAGNPTYRRDGATLIGMVRLMWFRPPPPGSRYYLSVLDPGAATELVPVHGSDLPVVFAPAEPPFLDAWRAVRDRHVPWAAPPDGLAVTVAPGAVLDPVVTFDWPSLPLDQALVRLSSATGLPIAQWTDAPAPTREAAWSATGQRLSVVLGAMAAQVGARLTWSAPDAVDSPSWGWHWVWPPASAPADRVDRRPAVAVGARRLVLNNWRENIRVGSTTNSLPESNEQRFMFELSLEPPDPLTPNARLDAVVQPWIELDGEPTTVLPAALAPPAAFPQAAPPPLPPVAWPWVRGGILARCAPPAQPPRRASLGGTLIVPPTATEAAFTFDNLTAGREVQTDQAYDVEFRSYDREAGTLRLRVLGSRDRPGEALFLAPPAPEVPGFWPFREPVFIVETAAGLRTAALVYESMPSRDDAGAHEVLYEVRCPAGIGEVVALHVSLAVPTSRPTTHRFEFRDVAFD
ncbi:MAG TPA: hypothetical protein DCZ72_09695, partial [Armatimonadetes bacterium]|nr:hypothetical protein [Armatimonadota bacterium]